MYCFLKNKSQNAVTNEIVFLFRIIMSISLTVFTNIMGVFSILNNFKSRKYISQEKNEGKARYQTVLFFFLM